ncbi:MAG: fused DSP-PTPase phosphatase/NAD kinase-like protein [Planctomycetota bacterium]
MKKKKQSPIGLIIIVLLVTAAVILLVRHFHVKNFHTIEPGVLYTSGQPRGMDYTRLLYKYHIGTIINVRSASEHREKNWYNEEITWVRNNGVNYVELPIEKDNYLPDKQIQDQFLAIMANKTNLPVLLHDSNGRKRVSILAVVWAVKARRYTVAEAIELVESIKENPLLEAEKDFITGLVE